MKHFVRLPLKAYIIFLSFTTYQQAGSTSIKGNLPSIPAVANFLTNFIKPMIDTQGKPNFRAKEDNSVINKIIYDKIKALKPLLQDNDPIEGQNTVTLEGEDDTHILEFLPSPKEALRFSNQTDDAARFKKLRKKIKKALNKEPISEETKKFITKSVDEMVAHIVSNKCVWTPGKAALRQGRTAGQPFTFNDMWKHLWEKIQTRYKKSGKGAEHENNLKFLEHFQEFVSEILNDTQILSEDYRVVCSIINMRNLNVTGIHSLMNDKMVARSKQRKNPDGLRAPDTAVDKNYIDGNETCSFFKVCSEELADFMTDFYINLNDTAVSTLSNYAAMFSRDVKEDYNNEKATVIELILQISSEIAQKINIIFKKQTDKFTLDKNKDKDSNVNALRRYIKKTVNHVKRQVTNDVAVKLRNLRPKLRVTIEKDIDVNLDVDLGNLEKELSTKICTVFEICNGRYVSRRNFDYTRPTIDKNHLFVRVQLTLDDQKKVDRKIALGVGQAMRNSQVTPLYRNINVTRTTAPFDVSTIRTDHSLVQNKVTLLMSDGADNEEKISIKDHTDKHTTTSTKKWNIKDSLEIYNKKFKHKKNKLNVTLNEHSNKKKHDKKQHSDSKKLNLALSEHSNKKKHDTKKHSDRKKSKKSKNKRGYNDFKSDYKKKYYKARESSNIEKDKTNSFSKLSTKISETKTIQEINPETDKDKTKKFGKQAKDKHINKKKHIENSKQAEDKHIRKKEHHEKHIEKSKQANDHISKKEHHGKHIEKIKLNITNQFKIDVTKDHQELYSENEKIYQKSQDSIEIVKSEEDDKTQTKVFKTVESLETYQEMNKDKQSKSNMTEQENKKKHHSKTHNKTDKDDMKLQPNKPKLFKTIESLETYQEVHNNKNETNVNMTTKDHKKKYHHQTHSTTKQHETKKKCGSKTNDCYKPKSDKGIIYQKSRDEKGNEKLETNKTNNVDNNKKQVVEEFKFNMTLGRVGINKKNEETQQKLKSDDEIYMRAQSENYTKPDEELINNKSVNFPDKNNTVKSDDDDDWYLEYRDANDTDTKIARRGGRRYDLGKQIDNEIENTKFDTIRDDSDNYYSESNEDYYDSEYSSQSREFGHQKKEYDGINNEIDSLTSDTIEKEIVF